MLSGSLSPASSSSLAASQPQHPSCCLPQAPCGDTALAAISSAPKALMVQHWLAAQLDKSLPGVLRLSPCSLARGEECPASQQLLLPAKRCSLLACKELPRQHRGCLKHALGGSVWCPQMHAAPAVAGAGKALNQQLSLALPPSAILPPHHQAKTEAIRWLQVLQRGWQSAARAHLS